MTLMEGYGMTESSPVISFNTPGAVKVGSVGRPIPGVEVRIAEDGEILTRGPHVMMGYWRDPDATARTIVDGWLHTGDVGHLDPDGYLFITDRKKDILITSGGKNVAPSELERLIVADPTFDQAVVFGDGRPFVGALVVPTAEAMEAEAARLGAPLDRDGEFLAPGPIVDAFFARVSTAMQAVSGPERVKAILVLGRPLSVDREEVTATLKVRRRHVLAEFADRIEALYQSKAASAALDV